MSVGDQPSLFDEGEAVRQVQRAARAMDGAKRAVRAARQEVARARRSDPLTSHDAAASIPSDKIRLSQQAVLGLIRDFGPMTDTQLAACYPGQQRTYGLPRQSESGLRTRRSELVAKGLVRDSGERVVLDSGRKSIVWAATG